MLVVNVADHFMRAVRRSATVGEGGGLSGSERLCVSPPQEQRGPVSEMPAQQKGDWRRLKSANAIDKPQARSLGNGSVKIATYNI